MNADKIIRVEVGLEVFHGFLLHVAAIVGINHHIIVERLDVPNLIDSDDVNFMAVFHYHPVDVTFSGA
jgi:hypothetical protein